MSCLAALPKSIEAIEGLIRDRGFGQTLPGGRKPRPLPVPGGMECLDARPGGGFPRGAISEITGQASSGRTGLPLALLARATRAGEVAAYVDATDSMDPRSAEQAGVILERLLWIRCGEENPARGGQAGRTLSPADEAWAAANLVVASGGFGVIAVDLGGFSRSYLGGWQRRTWIRLKHAVEGTRTALIVLAGKHLTGSAADVVLELRREHTEWGGLLGRIGTRAEIVMNRAQDMLAGPAR